MGKNKSIVSCYLRQGTETLKMKGLLDTGVDVTVIPKRRWLAHWELQPMAFIKGAQLARISKNIVQMEGLEGQLDTVCPFVADYKAPL